MKYRLHEIRKAVPGFEGKLSRFNITDGENHYREIKPVIVGEVPGNLPVYSVPVFTVEPLIEQTSGGQYYGRLKWHLFGGDGSYPCIDTEQYAISMHHQVQVFETQEEAQTLCDKSEQAFRQQVFEWLGSETK